jgi:hypothetical protein
MYSPCRVCSAEPKSGNKVCSRCKHVWYCSRKCQTTDWKQHKPNCTPLTNAAALERRVWKSESPPQLKEIDDVLYLGDTPVPETLDDHPSDSANTVRVGNFLVANVRRLPLPIGLACVRIKPKTNVSGEEIAAAATQFAEAVDKLGKDPLVRARNKRAIDALQDIAKHRDRLLPYSGDIDIHRIAIAGTLSGGYADLVMSNVDNLADSLNWKKLYTVGIPGTHSGDVRQNYAPEFAQLIELNTTKPCIGTTVLSARVFDDGPLGKTFKSIVFLVQSRTGEVYYLPVDITRSSRADQLFFLRIEKGDDNRFIGREINQATYNSAGEDMTLYMERMPRAHELRALDDQGHRPSTLSYTFETQPYLTTNYKIVNNVIAPHRVVIHPDFDFGDRPPVDGFVLPLNTAIGPATRMGGSTTEYIEPTEGTILFGVPREAQFDHYTPPIHGGCIHFVCTNGETSFITTFTAAHPGAVVLQYTDTGRGMQFTVLGGARWALPLKKVKGHHEMCQIGDIISWDEVRAPRGDMTIHQQAARFGFERTLLELAHDWEKCDDDNELGRFITEYDHMAAELPGRNAFRNLGRTAQKAVQTNAIVTGATADYMLGGLRRIQRKVRAIGYREKANELIALPGSALKNLSSDVSWEEVEDVLFESGMAGLAIGTGPLKQMLGRQHPRMASLGDANYSCMFDCTRENGDMEISALGPGIFHMIVLLGAETNFAEVEASQGLMVYLEIMCRLLGMSKVRICALLAMSALVDSTPKIRMLQVLNTIIWIGSSGEAPVLPFCMNLKQVSEGIQIGPSVKEDKLAIYTDMAAIVGILFRWQPENTAIQHYHDVFGRAISKFSTITKVSTPISNTRAVLIALRDVANRDLLDGARAKTLLKSIGTSKRTVGSLLKCNKGSELARCYDPEMVKNTLRREKYRLSNNPGYETAVKHAVAELENRTKMDISVVETTTVLGPIAIMLKTALTDFL